MKPFAASLVWASLVLAGCEAPPVRDGEAGVPSASAPEAAVVSAPEAPAAPAAEPTAAAPPDARDVALFVTRRDGLPERVFAFVAHEGRDAALLVDTGSQHTFLTHLDGRDGQPDVGTITLGGETRSVMGRPYALTGSDAFAGGRPVVGILGNDWLFDRPRELDVDGERLRAVDGEVPAGWTPLRYEDRYGYVFVRARLDGQDLLLGFDTGAVHTLWLGQEGRPGDTSVRTQDAYGTPLVLHLGEATLELGGEPRRAVPVLRAPSFPSLEESNERIGGGIHGLLGLSAVAGRTLRFDAARATIWASPR